MNLNDYISNEEYFHIGKKTTVCLLTLFNGFEIVTSSACLDEKNFNIETGKIISKELALQKLYEYLVVAYAIKLKGELHE